MLVDYFEEVVEGEEPAFIDEGCGAARVVVELVREGEEVGERVDFVFAFEDLAGLVGWVDGVALAVVAGFYFAGWWWLEGVAVWRGDHVLGLGIYCSQQQVLNRLVLLRKSLVLCQLICTVT